MAQPRYNETLKRFMHDWRPNGNAELTKKFFDDTRRLVAAIVEPADKVIEVETILAPRGGIVVMRLGGFEAQLGPIEAQHVALSLFEAATSARTESFLKRFLIERVGVDEAAMARLIADFRGYRTEELQRELDRNLAKDEAAARTV